MNMKLVHNLTITSYIKKDDDEAQIEEAILQLLPEDLEKEKIRFIKEKVSIDKETTMNILSVRLNKTRHLNVIIKKLKELLGEAQIALIREQENRVDEEGNCYIRIDKQLFVTEQKMMIVDHGNCLHFKFVLAAYPKTKSNAVKIMKEIFS